MKLLRKVSLALAVSGCLVLSGEVKTTDALIYQVREVGDKLMCDCGCGSQVSTCNMLSCSGREPMVADIKTHLAEGLSVDAIIEAIVAKYGDGVRALPPAEGFGLVGWAMPFVVLGLGLAIAPIVVRRLKNRPASENASNHKPLDPAAVERIKAEIDKDLDDLV